MATIVDKVLKRKKIALACKDIILENGIRNVTISKLAESAGVGKGSIYVYFENKEDIVFEIINIMMLEYNERKEKQLSKVSSTKEKVRIFLSFFYNSEDSELIQIYKEFISILLSNPNKSMIEFQAQCSKSHHDWFLSIIQNGIESGELIPESKGLAKGLCFIGEGMFVVNSISSNPNVLEKDTYEFINTVFELIEVK